MCTTDSIVQATYTLCLEFSKKNKKHLTESNLLKVKDSYDVNPYLVTCINEIQMYPTGKIERHIF